MSSFGPGDQCSANPCTSTGTHVRPLVCAGGLGHIFSSPWLGPPWHCGCFLHYFAICGCSWGAMCGVTVLGHSLLPWEWLSVGGPGLSFARWGEAGLRLGWRGAVPGPLGLSLAVGRPSIAVCHCPLSWMSSCSRGMGKVFCALRGLKDALGVLVWPVAAPQSSYQIHALIGLLKGLFIVVLYIWLLLLSFFLS